MASKKTAHARKRSNEKVRKKNSLNPLILIFIVIIVIIVAVVGFILLSGNGGNTDDNNPPSTNENPIAVIDTSMGIIKVELYEDKAPNTVENFIDYANNNFYNGLVFHRVANLISTEPNTHIIQGGGFYPNGTYKPPIYDPINLEINDDLKHVDGAIAMARTSDPNSATSQFYICDGVHSFLDGNYAVFGVVTEGMDVVRAIAAVQTTERYGMQDWPVENVIINSIIIEE